MPVSLTGRRAIVTGAAVGIGTAYARALAAEGVHLVVCDIRPEIKELAEELNTPDTSCVGYVADVAEAEDVRRVVDGAVSHLGGIDILINNAGVVWQTHADDDLDKTLVDYERIVGTNLFGEFLMGRAAITQMIRQGTGGEIVNVATDHMATCGSPFELCPRLETCPWADAPRPTGGGEVMDLYDTSKWALNGLMYAWAKALRPHNIRVNALCMGATDSWMIRDFFGFPQTRDAEDDEQRATVDTWMAKEETAQVLIELLQEGPEGRNAQNLNLCIGRPVCLEPALPHRYITSESLHA